MAHSGPQKFNIMRTTIINLDRQEHEENLFPHHKMEDQKIRNLFPTIIESRPDVNRGTWE
jgi:hypothetical protein